MRSSHFSRRSYLRNAALFGLAVGMAACKPDPTSFEFRVAQDSPESNYSAALVPGEADSIYVSKEAGVSLAQIDSIQPSIIDSGLLLNVWFSAEGKERLATMTESNIGRRLAVVVGSQVMNAPVIVQRIAPTDGAVTVSIAVQKDSAESFAKRLTYSR